MSSPSNATAPTKAKPLPLPEYPASSPPAGLAGATSPPKSQTPKVPSFRNSNDPHAATNMTASSTPLGNLNALRRPGLPPASVSSPRGSQLPQDVQAKMKAFHLSRRGAPSASNLRMPPHTVERSLSGSEVPPLASPDHNDTISGASFPSIISNPCESLSAGPGVMKLASSGRPPPSNFNSAPAVPNVDLKPKKGLAAKRGLHVGMKLSNASGPPPTSQEKEASSDAISNHSIAQPGERSESLFNKYSDYVDTKAGTLKFKGKATVHGTGIDFSSGTSFNISLDEVDTLDELGKGNYGTVYKVRHSRPQLRKPGRGLDGNRALPALVAVNDGVSPENMQQDALQRPANAGSSTGMIMAMKEIRLELDEAKFAAIIMELDILHRCISPFIVDFYGAFFQEGAVYICMEFMDGGSIDKLYGDGVPENVLRKISLATVMGLKSLKDEHNIIHRDVKPTNILINTKGQVKICDFGVSGNLVASIAKTNIGCQSYMAPERISGGGVMQAGANPGGGTYSVQSDIWSLGLTIIECAMGQYPYPPETYDNIFSQLSVGTSIWCKYLD